MSVELCVKLRDAHQMAVDALNDELEKKAPVEAKYDSKDFDQLAWSVKEGTKRSYEQTTKEANRNSEIFQALQSILKEKNGFCILAATNIGTTRAMPTPLTDERNSGREGATWIKRFP